MASQTASASDGSETQGRKPPHPCLADLPDGSDLTSKAPHLPRMAGRQAAPTRAGIKEGHSVLPPVLSSGDTEENRNSWRPRGQEKVSHQRGLVSRHSLTGVAAEVCWRELADNLRGGCQAGAESTQHSQPPGSSKQTTGRRSQGRASPEKAVSTD